MKLYHYAEQLYSPLMTRHRKGGVSNKEYQSSLVTANMYHKVGSYFDHVSFFFEPIPLGEIGKIFATDKPHHTWVNGKVLYEHIVDSDLAPKDMRYNIVETPALREFWMKENLSDHDDDNQWIDAFSRASALQKRIGEIGAGVASFNAVAPKYANGILKHYLTSKKSDRWDSNQRKYAADVPHVMIYSQIGTFQVELINLVTVGSETRKPVSNAAHLRW